MARGKSIVHFCSHCEREVKMSMIGPVEDQESKVWYRCTRCRHATLVDIEEKKKALENSKKVLDPNDCIEYNPQNTYQVGESIFHSEWEDVGKIISKEKTSAGASAIVVAFQKNGEKRLMENLLDSPDDV